MKKRFLSIIGILLGLCLNAQVSIGKPDVSSNSVLLDFYDESDNYKGLILPIVDDLSSALASNASENNGTFLFDRSDKKLKMYENGVWVTLSDEGEDTAALVNPSSELSEDSGVILGSDLSQAKGVLILESNSKAMVLPKINTPHLTVKNPYPGMICYDTVSKSIALFDGKVWNYWK